ncbi:MAG TPA: type II toxin-antitoxin system prevent-host-death family antitoxin [bacterium]|nr:type II toxin-antitoxin system prevent-host-death family antitoxin [bacterium]
MAKIVGVKEAHRQLTKLIRAAEGGQQIVMTREGSPVAVLLGTDDYNSLMATLEEMADPEALRALRLEIGFDRLIDDPTAGDPLRGEWRGYWKLRAGDYRVIYSIAGADVLEVQYVRDRRKAYRR